MKPVLFLPAVCAIYQNWTYYEVIISVEELVKNFPKLSYLKYKQSNILPCIKIIFWLIRLIDDILPLILFSPSVDWMIIVWFLKY